jgi:predicted patatin/cPLA2 family phospholipase
VITRYTTNKLFFDPLRFVRGGNLIDLDWLVETGSKKSLLVV